jgi:serine/threonine protein kinase
MSETIAGTLTIMAPEMINGKKYDCSVDVWSLGTLLYQILVGKIPFSAKNHNELK